MGPCRRSAAGARRCGRGVVSPDDAIEHLEHQIDLCIERMPPEQARELFEGLHDKIETRMSDHEEEHPELYAQGPM